MRQTLTASRAMVTAPHHLASQSALAVLREGGNAIEAMVAAAATIAVVYPHMNAIGGDGFWIISEPGKPPVGIDACGRASQMATVDFYTSRGLTSIPGRGPLAANTSTGAISGWIEALEHSSRSGGNMPVARLLQDAQWYAEHGAPVTQSQVNFTTKFLSELRDQPGFSSQFLEQGHVPKADTLRKYPALARTFKFLSERGLEDFYQGSLAQTMAAEHERVGSPVRLVDLHSQRATSVHPLSVRISGATLYNMTPPTQGLSSLQILAIFDRLRQRHQIDEVDSYAYLHALVESTKQAFKIRNRHITDPDVMALRGSDPAQFLSDAFLDKCADAVDMQKALPWPEKPIPGDTIWMGTADASGRMVSYIQSVYWEFGSGLVLQDTGVLWQNRGSSFSLDAKSHNSLSPGKKPFHTLNPAHARFDDGRHMVYGNMGGDGQPQSQSAVFSRYAMYGMGLQQAVSAPRWLLGKTWGQETTTLKFENRFATEAMDQMRTAGHDVEIFPEYSDTMGHAGAIVRQPNGLYLAAADPRSDGVVAGF